MQCKIANYALILVAILKVTSNVTVFSKATKKHTWFVVISLQKRTACYYLTFSIICITHSFSHAANI